MNRFDIDGEIETIEDISQNNDNRLAIVTICNDNFDRFSVLYARELNCKVGEKVSIYGDILSTRYEKDGRTFYDYTLFAKSIVDYDLLSKVEM